MNIFISDKKPYLYSKSQSKQYHLKMNWHETVVRKGYILNE